MSFETITTLLPVLIFSLVAYKFFKAKRNVKGGWPQVQATIIKAHLNENDTGSVTQYYPSVDVKYEAGGQAWQVTNLGVPLETNVDRTIVEKLIASKFAPGSQLTIAHDPAAPGRVMIV